MKNVTFSAREDLIEAGRQRALAENTTLNEQFWLWLESYARRQQQADEAASVMKALQGKLRIGRKLSREEMHER